MITIQSPPDGTVLLFGTTPTFDIGSNCNTKFKLEISSLSGLDPSKTKGYTYKIKDLSVDMVF